MNITEKIKNWFRPKKKVVDPTPPVRTNRQYAPVATKPTQRSLRNVRITRRNTPYYNYSYINGYWYDTMYIRVNETSKINELSYLLNDSFYYSFDNNYYDPSIYHVAPNYDFNYNYYDPVSEVTPPDFDTSDKFDLDSKKPSEMDFGVMFAHDFTPESRVKSEDYDFTPSKSESKEPDFDTSSQSDFSSSFVDTTPSYVEPTQSYSSSSDNSYSSNSYDSGSSSSSYDSGSSSNSYDSGSSSDSSSSDF